jgi:glycerol uptake facilitator-like aquaporin
VANILIFETTGSFLLSYGFVIYGGYSTIPGHPYIYLLLTSGIYFASLLWSARYCFPSLNPAITLANMLISRKQMPPLMGCLYLACQFFGILCGCMLGFSTIYDHNTPAMDYLSTAVEQSEVSLFIQPFLSTFIYMVIILLMTTPSLSFTEI